MMNNEVKVSKGSYTSQTLILCYQMMREWIQKRLRAAYFLITTGYI
jgi:hypothetical protein